ALYEHRQGDRAGTAIDAATLRKADRAERELRLAGLEAERRRVFELARHRQISDEVARRVVREIDLLEARYRG
nr:Na+/H+ antiporter [Luteimonas sp.]